MPLNEMTDEQQAAMVANRIAKATERREQMAEGHTVRAESGGTVLIKPYSIRRAIALNCTECMGFAASEVKNCTSALCPIFPFRRGTLLSKKGRAVVREASGA
jgi:hypothetical protein